LAKASCWLYETAGRMVAPLLQLEYVRHIYIRRSVAAGEAEFPWSDLDLGVVIEPASGADLWRLCRRFRLTQLAFPRMGECQMATADELAEMTEMDPYRGSLDRRYAISLVGGPPPIPAVPVTPEAAARRLVFWFEHYLPVAMRQRNVRNQWKFSREMANALGVMERRWPEPLRSRREAEVPKELRSLSTFAQCCAMAERAQALLRRPAPRLAEVLHRPGLILVPDHHTPMPRLPAKTLVMTPPVLDLLMATQRPGLWLSHGIALRDLGFVAPPLQAWTAWCYRQTSGERLRQPGFGDAEPIMQATRLARAEAVLETLEAGRAPEAIVDRPEAESTNVQHYYQEAYDRLADRSVKLRQRVLAIMGAASRSQSATRSGAVGTMRPPQAPT
jgi:hypothetical protein